MKTLLLLETVGAHHLLSQRCAAYTNTRAFRGLHVIRRSRIAESWQRSRIVLTYIYPAYRARVASLQLRQSPGYLLPVSVVVPRAFARSLRVGPQTTVDYTTTALHLLAINITASWVAGRLRLRLLRMTAIAQCKWQLTATLGLPSPDSADALASRGCLLKISPMQDVPEAQRRSIQEGA